MARVGPQRHRKKNIYTVSADGDVCTYVSPDLCWSAFFDAGTSTQIFIKFWYGRYVVRGAQYP